MYVCVVYCIVFVYECAYLYNNVRPLKMYRFLDGVKAYDEERQLAHATNL